MFRIPYPQLNHMKSPAGQHARLEELSIDLPLDERILSAAEGSPLAQPIEVFGKTAGNRWGSSAHSLRSILQTRSGL